MASSSLPGVLATTMKSGPLDATLFANLGYVVHATGAALVISSSWRKSAAALRFLLDGLQRYAGIPAERILGVTPSLCDGVECRAAEIAGWLRAHPQVAAKARWAAIDDQDIQAQSPALFRGHFVRTDPTLGLTRERARQAVQLLLPAHWEGQRAVAAFQFL
mmetsp:Transcript_105546/g.340385  ORF Transcript_105546/g.340385 Transcript_105546/m.340385 type:complete len:162 (-) Transcript_105546:26-511(-)